MRITPPKFGGDWILHPEILEFGFYPLTFESVWILHPDIQNLDFTPYIFGVIGSYSLKFRSVWILHLKVSEFRGLKSKYSLTLGNKIQILKRPVLLKAWAHLSTKAS